MCSYYFLEVTLWVTYELLILVLLVCTCTVFILTDSISLSRNVLDRKGDNVDVSDGKFSFYIKEALKEVFGQVQNYIY